ncbi:MAG: type I restriction enzyme HsdR N-terminal domain-containing protein [Candidatus Eisenbacteria bacterium]
MARSSVDPELRSAIRKARKVIQEAEKADCNEAETRRRIERIFEDIMGYSAFDHLSRERAVRGAGETEHVDFAIQLESKDGSIPVIMVEIKRVTVDLAPKHLRQVSSYAINAGCEWILLTNSKEWRLYHITFGQPPVTKLIHSWNLLTDDIALLADRFDLISLKSVKKGTLDELWRKTNVLLPKNMLQAILSEDTMRTLRRELRKTTGVLVTLEDIVAAIRRLLNEAAISELDGLRLTWSDKKKPKKKRAVKASPASESAEDSVDEDEHVSEQSN